jgi:hypothetical protein
MQFGSLHARIKNGPRDALLALLVSGCADDGTSVSYAKDVQPIFERRCVACHYSNNDGLVDIEDPFTPDFDAPAPGLVSLRTPGARAHALPPYIIAPFAPEQSFLLQKVTDPELKPGCDPEAGYCKWEDAGFFMPPAPTRLPDPKLEAVRRWIDAGAKDDDVFRSEVRNIFGDPDARSTTECQSAGMEAGCIVCITCHYSGAPITPDLTRPFDPIVGIVGVKSTFRTDLDIVKAGNADASFLVNKLEAFGASSELGAPMPYRYPALSESDVAKLREWIALGAPNN